MIRQILGGPGVTDEQVVTRKFVFRDGKFDPLPGGGWIDPAKSRNPFTLPVENLEPGLLMGKLTATQRWAPSFFGATTAGITGASTSLTIGAREAVELVRRIGTSGTFTLLGPPAANGVARQVTVTFSAVDTVTGIVTITAIGSVNQVDHVRFSTLATGGNLQLTVTKTDGTRVTTGNAAWNATDATFLSNINTALDTATGVVGGIVATALPGLDTDTGIQLAYSGTGYAGKSWAPAAVAVLPTGATNPYVTTPVAAAGSFATGSLLGDTDGSQVPLTCIPPGYGIPVAASGVQVVGGVIQYPWIPIAGIVAMEQLVPNVSDLGIRAWIKDQMSSTRGGKFVFTDTYGAVGH